MNRTIQYLNADLARAQQQGAKTLDISTADLAEVIRLAERGASLEEVDKAKKRGGWVSPAALLAMISGKAKTVRIHRKRSDRANTQLFYAADLRAMKVEADAAVGVQQ